jgi:HSP20 family molecular chaperone IbpA
MKLPVLLAGAALGVAAVFSPLRAQTLAKDLPRFDRVAASPLITLVLEPGDQERVRLEYSGVDPEKINYEVHGKTLRIYLDDARYAVRDHKYWRDGYEYRRPLYDRNVRVTAYVTYKRLRSIEKRGEENVTCKGPLAAKRCTVRLFGEVDAELESVTARRFKAAMFGENTLRIASGQAARQRYRSFGENTVDTRNVAGSITSTSTFGDSHFRLNASDQMRVTTFGESDVRFTGGGQLSKRLVFGEASISKMD